MMKLFRFGLILMAMGAGASSFALDTLEADPAFDLEAIRREGEALGQEFARLHAEAAAELQTLQEQLWLSSTPLAAKLEKDYKLDPNDPIWIRAQQEAEPLGTAIGEAKGRELGIERGTAHGLDLADRQFLDAARRGSKAPDSPFTPPSAQDNIPLAPAPGLKDPIDFATQVQNRGVTLAPEIHPLLPGNPWKLTPEELFRVLELTQTVEQGLRGAPLGYRWSELWLSSGYFRSWLKSSSQLELAQRYRQKWNELRHNPSATQALDSATEASFFENFSRDLKSSLEAPGIEQLKQNSFAIFTRVLAELLEEHLFAKALHDLTKKAYQRAFQKVFFTHYELASRTAHSQRVQFLQTNGLLKQLKLKLININSPLLTDFAIGDELAVQILAATNIGLKEASLAFQPLGFELIETANSQISIPGLTSIVSESDEPRDWIRLGKLGVSGPMDFLNFPFEVRGEVVFEPSPLTVESLSFARPLSWARSVSNIVKTPILHSETYTNWVASGLAQEWLELDCDRESYTKGSSRLETLRTQLETEMSRSPLADDLRDSLKNSLGTHFQPTPPWWVSGCRRAYTTQREIVHQILSYL